MVSRSVKQKEFIIFLFIIAIIVAFVSQESQRVNFLVIIGSAIGGLVAMVSYDVFIRDWLFTA